jgi:hypothetical protein
LKHKEKLGSRYRRQYEKPQTAYQRLVKRRELSTPSRQRLNSQHQELNPVRLKKKLEQDLKTFFTALGNLNCEATNP